MFYSGGMVSDPAAARDLITYEFMEDFKKLPHEVESVPLKVMQKLLTIRKQKNETSETVRQREEFHRTAGQSLKRSASSGAQKRTRYV